MTPCLVLVAALAPLVLEEPTSLDGLLEPIRERAALPALGAAIVSGDQLVAIGAVGKRRIDAESPVTASDLWHLGSCTKSMTATWVATRVEAGEIEWGTTLGDVYPDLVESGAMHADWRAVTLEMLLTNSSGAPTALNAGGLWQKLWRHEGTPAEQRRTLVEGVLARKPAAPPGTKFIYSNAGFSIAAAMTEKVLEATWEERIRSDLFVPLGMTRAGFGAPGEKGTVAQPFGHRTRGGDLGPVELGPGDDNPSAIAPAGKVHAPLEDWARYAALHLAARRGASELLSAESAESLHKPRKGNYAMGWMVREYPWAKGPALWHNGSNTMWYCEIALFPESNCAVLVATNCAGDRARGALEVAVKRLYEHHVKR
ncbi:MAG: beta-lactamase family protein [bacterium]|nr:beta-lactamase family protein [bacterium]